MNILLVGQDNFPFQMVKSTLKGENHRISVSTDAADAQFKLETCGIG